MASITLVTAILGCTFGLLGAVLGIINTWRAFVRDQVRIKVIPTYAFDERNEYIGIEITNLSAFPVTITGFGFLLEGREKNHIPVLNSDCWNCTIPARMETRTSINAFIPMAFCSRPEFALVKEAYAKTACGKRVTGNSAALQAHIKKMKRR
jgi:hypothetical protein